MFDQALIQAPLGATGSFDPTTLLANRNDPGRQAADQRNMSEIRRTAEDYEAVFLTQMLEHMWAEIEPNPVFGGGQAETVFRSLLLNEYGKEMAKAGGIGLADQVERELLALQEAS